MSEPTASESLRGKLLIAMPGMGDPRFERSVVFLCEHTPQGAMGLIINKPLTEVRFSELVEQLGLRDDPPLREIPVHFGGPVDHTRGFVLHSTDFSEGDATLEVDDTFSMTATLDLVRAIADGAGPAQAIFTLGYAGWGAGQLEDEIQKNGWLTADATREVVFHRDEALKWTLALKSLGIPVEMLSASAGRA